MKRKKIGYRKNKKSFAKGMKHNATNDARPKRGGFRF